MQLFKNFIVIASILALPLMSHAAVVDVATSNKTGTELLNSTRTGQAARNDAGHVDTATENAESKVETTVNDTSYVSSTVANRAAASRAVQPVPDSGSQRTLDNLYRHH